MHLNMTIIAVGIIGWVLALIVGFAWGARCQFNRDLRQIDRLHDTLEDMRNRAALDRETPVTSRAARPEFWQDLSE